MTLQPGKVATRVHDGSRLLELRRLSARWKELAEFSFRICRMMMVTSSALSRTMTTCIMCSMYHPITWRSWSTLLHTLSSPQGINDSDDLCGALQHEQEAWKKTSIQQHSWTLKCIHVGATRNVVVVSGRFRCRVRFRFETWIAPSSNSCHFLSLWNRNLCDSASVITELTLRSCMISVKRVVFAANTCIIFCANYRNASWSSDTWYDESPSVNDEFWICIAAFQVAHL